MCSYQNVIVWCRFFWHQPIERKGVKHGNNNYAICDFLPDVLMEKRLILMQYTTFYISSLQIEGIGLRICELVSSQSVHAYLAENNADNNCFKVFVGLYIHTI